MWSPEDLAALARRRLCDEASIGIFDLMEAQGVTRAQLADRLSKSRAHITKMLSGEHNFTLGTLADVYGALGRSVHFVLTHKGAAVRSPFDELAVTEATVTLGVNETHGVAVWTSRYDGDNWAIVAA
jgi:transcriptional regulator with XRE-family HTH domain